MNLFFRPAITALLRDGLRPRVLELADRHSIDHVRAKARYRFPANAGAIVLLEVGNRSIPVGYQPGEAHNTERCVLLRRYLD